MSELAIWPEQEGHFVEFNSGSTYTRSPALCALPKEARGRFYPRPRFVAQDRRTRDAGVSVLLSSVIVICKLELLPYQIFAKDQCMNHTTGGNRLLSSFLFHFVQSRNVSFDDLG
jgi:hypothetical protein